MPAASPTAIRDCDQTTSDRRVANRGATSTSVQPRPLRWHQSTLAIGLLGSFLLFAAAAARLVAAGMDRPATVADFNYPPDLLGRRPKLTLYFVGFAFWMGTLHWLRLPHWATSIGWVAMSAYLAVYPLLFVALAGGGASAGNFNRRCGPVGMDRSGSRARVHASAASPCRAWRIHNTDGSLGFSLADVIGGYGLGGLVMLVAASLARMLPWAGQRLAVWPIVPLAAAFAGPLAYGTWRTSGETYAARRNRRADSRRDRHHVRG